MNNPFKRTGFDCLISKGTNIEGALYLEQGAVTLLDGTMRGECILVTRTGDTSKEKNTTLLIAGSATALQRVEVTNVTITGELTCDVLVVDGTLAVKNGAKVTARLIKYRSLVVEPKANLNGTMEHLESASEVKAEQ